MSNEAVKREFLAKLDQFPKLLEPITTLQKLLAPENSIEVHIESDKVYVLEKKSGLKMHWQLSDPRTAVACLAVAGEYEPRETSLIKTIVRHAKYIVDVGANIGYYSVIIPLFEPNLSKVYAFEPVPKSFYELNQNIILNGLRNSVTSFNLAVSNKEEKITLFIPETFGTSATSSVELHPEVQNFKVEVDAIRLDDFIENGNVLGCDFLKIDVEGAEKFVLEGAMKMLDLHKPVILAEILRKWSGAHGYKPKEILDLLSGLEYKCFAIGSNLREIVEIDDDVVETNFLFLNPDNPLHKLTAIDLGLKI